MGYVDMMYWKLAAVCLVVGLVFFFLTTESLIRGKLQLPAWVFSSFTCVLGIYFFRIFLQSLAEFQSGRHESIDDLLDVWETVVRLIT